MNGEELMALQETELRQAIRGCDAYTARYGLTLSEENIGELMECRAAALQRAGRVEFGGGILPRLIAAFCDSPYLMQENYARTLSALQEAFYYYKTETLDRYTDDELIDYMVRVFNGRAQGSVDYLTGTALDALGRKARGGEGAGLR
jgi:hypothetical protein